MNTDDLDHDAHQALRDLRHLISAHIQPSFSTIEKWRDIIAAFLARDKIWGSPVDKTNGSSALVLYFADDGDRDEFVAIFKARAGGVRTRALR
jgi:hypothetical protein